MANSSSQDTIKEYGRGIIGGLIFSLPLIYTMEVWWTGFVTSPEALLSCILFTFLLLLGYNRYAGMRRDSTFWDLCWDSFEEIGLAFVVSFVFLLAIGQVKLNMSSDEIIGKVVVESMIVAIGISVGTAQFSQSDDETGMGRNKSEKSKINRYLSLIILGVCGATLFAASVAPTEEITMIAAECSEANLISLIMLSLLLCYIILYFSEFRGSRRGKSTLFEISLIVFLTYMVAMFVSFAMLLFFGRVIDNSLYVIISQMIVLGLPAAIGASAGRLLIGGGNQKDDE